MSHTPGPWMCNRDAFHQEGQERWFVGTVDGSRYVATCDATKGNKANARLIAAAPDLLAACKDAAIAMVGGKTGCEYCAAQLDGQAPYSQPTGEGHISYCPVPRLLAAIAKDDAEAALAVGHDVLCG